jgi:hypothetical protein
MHVLQYYISSENPNRGGALVVMFVARKVRLSNVRTIPIAYEFY